MEPTYDESSDTYQQHTRRFDRERGFTRACFVVVPEWEPMEAWECDDAAIALRTVIEDAWTHPMRTRLHA